jgi:glutamate N-acetyltransferase/amino-acid N-acetyltransferase
MEREEIKITVDLALGKYAATSYGCDLSYDYVRINSEYST